MTSDYEHDSVPLRENAEEATQGWAELAAPQDFSSPSDATTE